jgi:hypothetical protein
MIEQMTDNGNDASIDEAITYLYDANDRLTTESLDSDVPLANGVDQTTTYGYDHTQQTSKIVYDGVPSSPPSPLDARNSQLFTYDLQGRMSQVKTEGEVESVRRSVLRGTPFGSDNWITQSATRLELQHTLRSRGRPKKQGA